MNKTFIIAEAGVNHNGRLDLALRLCDAAKAAGADAVKFQTWVTEKIVAAETEMADYQQRNLGGRGSQFEMLKGLELSYAQFAEIKTYCDRIGICFLSTGDNPEDIDFTPWEKTPRAKMPVRDADERNKDFLEVNKGFDEAVARAEAGRCLECGCHDFFDCDLIRYAQQIPDLHPEHYNGIKHPDFTEERLVVIERNQGKCITCGLCVRVCDEEVGAGLLGRVDRGFNTTLKPEFKDPKAAEICKTCLRCAEECPTGALRIIER